MFTRNGSQYIMRSVGEDEIVEFYIVARWHEETGRCQRERT